MGSLMGIYGNFDGKFYGNYDGNFNRNFDGIFDGNFNGNCHENYNGFSTLRIMIRILMESPKYNC